MSTYVWDAACWGFGLGALVTAALCIAVLWRGETHGR